MEDQESITITAEHYLAHEQLLDEAMARSVKADGAVVTVECVQAGTAADLAERLYEMCERLDGITYSGHGCDGPDDESWAIRLCDCAPEQD
jgi:hypothetical protein